MLQVIDTNFFQHSWRIPELTNGMKVSHSEHLTYVDSGLSCDTFNIIHIHQGKNLSKAELTEAIDYFKSRNLEFCIWISQENLTEKASKFLQDNSVSQQNQEVGMILDLNDYQVTNSSSSIQIVDYEEKLKDYATVIAENWTPTDQNVMRYFEKTAHHYLNPENNIILLVYYHENRPVSTVEMFPSSDKTMGLYGFATLASHRGLGIGTSLMTFSLNKAKELGYKRAVLQASDDGIGIYKKFGFREITTYFEFA